MGIGFRFFFLEGRITLYLPSCLETVKRAIFYDLRIKLSSV